MERDDFDRHIEELPEPKIELLDGFLSIGNGAGNERLLHHVLEGWGAEAAIPMAPTGLWREALAQGFRRFDPPAPHRPLETWRAWASQLSYRPELALAGPMIHVKHRAARQAMTMGLFQLTGRRGFALVSGRDVIMRLGNDAFTPDLFAVKHEQHRLNKHYLDGPADLAIEVLLPGHEAYDSKVKFQRYEAGAVQEYWLVDPVRKAASYFHLKHNRYQQQQPDADGRFRSRVFPSLAFNPAILWSETDACGHGPNPFSVETEMPQSEYKLGRDGVAWGDLPFDPRPVLEPCPLTFDEFASWAPEAKFELIDGKPWIGGSRGSRNVLGMLLRNQGLARSVTVLHPRHWIAALSQAEEDRREDTARREHWWQIAHEAAALLRNKFGIGRLVVIGDLIHPHPLNLWSEIKLVLMEEEKLNTFEAFRYLDGHLTDATRLDLVEYKHASRAEREEVETLGRGL